MTETGWFRLQVDSPTRKAIESPTNLKNFESISSLASLLYPTVALEL